MYSRITKILVGGGRGYACTGKDIKRQCGIMCTFAVITCLNIHKIMCRNIIQRTKTIL